MTIIVSRCLYKNSALREISYMKVEIFISVIGKKKIYLNGIKIA